uniref:Uncharacterized protein n=1 Tax=Romanomermis culicivorax TaxID=13658 RepID=A0A915ILY6_ROMCU
MKKEEYTCLGSCQAGKRSGLVEPLLDMALSYPLALFLPAMADDQNFPCKTCEGPLQQFENHQKMAKLKWNVV